MRSSNGSTCTGPSSWTSRVRLGAEGENPRPRARGRRRRSPPRDAAAQRRDRRLVGPHHAGARGPPPPRLDHGWRDRPAQRRDVALSPPDTGPRDRGAVRAHDRRRDPPDARPAIVGSAELRRALEEDPSVGETLTAARAAPTAIFGMGVLGAESVHVASGYLGEAELAALGRAGAVGDVLGRFLAADGRIALPALDRRTIGLPLEELRSKALVVGLVAGPGRGPIALAALRAGCVTVPSPTRPPRSGCSPMPESRDAASLPPPALGRRDPRARRTDRGRDAGDGRARAGRPASGPEPARAAATSTASAPGPPPRPGPARRPAPVAIAIGADHGGYALKDRIGQVLGEAASPSATAGPRAAIPSTTRTSPMPSPARWPTAPAAGESSSMEPDRSCMVANKVPRRPGGPLPRPLERPQQPRAQPRQRPDPRGALHGEGLATRSCGPGWARNGGRGAMPRESTRSPRSSAAT